MITGVEEIPQSLPAECTFSGHSSSSCDKFIRVQLPNNYYWDNILISEHFFAEMAKEMNFSPITEREKLLKSIKEDSIGLAPVLTSLLNRIDILRSELDGLQSLATRLESLSGSIEHLLEPVDASGTTAKSNSSVKS